MGNCAVGHHESLIESDPYSPLGTYVIHVIRYCSLCGFAVSIVTWDEIAWKQTGRPKPTRTTANPF